MGADADRKLQSLNPLDAPIEEPQRPHPQQMMLTPSTAATSTPPPGPMVQALPMTPRMLPQESVVLPPSNCGGSLPVPTDATSQRLLLPAPPSATLVETLMPAGGHGSPGLRRSALPAPPGSTSLKPLIPAVVSPGPLKRSSVSPSGGGGQWEPGQLIVPMASRSAQPERGTGAAMIAEHQVAAQFNQCISQKSTSNPQMPPTLLRGNSAGRLPGPNRLRSKSRGSGAGSVSPALAFRHTAPEVLPPQALPQGMHISQLQPR